MIEDVARPMWICRCWGQTSQKLQHDHTERIDLTALRDAACPRVQRASIAWRAADGPHCHVQSPAVPGGAAETKVGHLGCAMPVDQDVCRLDISVERLWLGVVHVGEACRGIQKNAQALVKMERQIGSRILALLKPLEGVTAGQQLVDQVPVQVVLTPTQQGHKVGVPEFAEHLHLLIEAGHLSALTRGPEGRQVDGLDGDLRAVLELALVDRSVGARAELPRSVPIHGG
mmetsp:Transcript_103932/g.269091  ORF Transcript_103932/g.269091 Transcript_103932/m.269091 type:complete len:230 (-) Transcript_103932:78-767(-)